MRFLNNISALGNQPIRRSSCKHNLALLRLLILVHISQPLASVKIRTTSDSVKQLLERTNYAQSLQHSPWCASRCFQICDKFTTLFGRSFSALGTHSPKFNSEVGRRHCLTFRDHHLAGISTLFLLK